MKGNVVTFILLSLVVMCLFLSGCERPNVTQKKGATTPATTTPPNFKIAFIADQGEGAEAKAVLDLIRSEGTNMAIHSGDLDYDDDPEGWDRMISDTLGPNFPYFVSIGNHDDDEWPRYQEKLQERLKRIDGAVCDGDLGVKSACSYQGVCFILSGVGERGKGHVDYIRDHLASCNSIWRFCSWHHPHPLMQIGSKDKDKVGWGPYEECREAGAIIANGHSHTYSRTHLMSDFETQHVASTSSPLVIKKGETFSFVSGLAGKSMRKPKDKFVNNPWWAAVYSTDQDANFGALFCTLNQDGKKGKGYCYFKDIEGRVADSFHVVSKVMG